ARGGGRGDEYQPLSAGDLSRADDALSRSGNSCFEIRARNRQYRADILHPAFLLATDSGCNRGGGVVLLEESKKRPVGDKRWSRTHLSCCRTPILLRS